MDLPLSGLTVLDLSRALAGPICAMLLGDLGADVIKIENPSGGDEARGWGPPYVAGESAYFLSINRNKRSITVNIRTPEGADLVRRLAARADVLIENFGPGVAERYTLDAASLRARNEGLVYCTIAGFAPGSRYEHVPGYDFVIQAMSGLMSITGEPDGQPQKVGVAVVDVLAGLFASSTVLAALYERRETGKGGHVTVSLIDAALASLVNVASAHLVTGAPPRRWGNEHASLAPYSPFDAADRPIAVGVGNDAQFARLCGLLGLPKLADDERFRTNADRVGNRAALLPLLNEAFRRRPAAEWASLLWDARVPAAPINTVDEIFADPYVREAGMVAEADHETIGPVPLVANPTTLDGERPPVRAAPPTLGGHTDEILREVLGLPEEEIRRLHDAGAV